jgi:hypothetical protein
MEKLTLDAALWSKLQQSKNGKVELCDESGHTIGYFIPVESYRQFQYAWANAQVTDEELEQARREPGGSSLPEILEQMEKGCDTQ